MVQSSSVKRAMPWTCCYMTDRPVIAYAISRWADALMWLTYAGDGIDSLQVVINEADTIKRRETEEEDNRSLSFFLKERNHSLTLIKCDQDQNDRPTEQTKFAWTQLDYLNKRPILQSVCSANFRLRSLLLLSHHRRLRFTHSRVVSCPCPTLPRLTCLTTTSSVIFLNVKNLWYKSIWSMAK